MKIFVGVMFFFFLIVFPILEGAAFKKLKRNVDTDSDARVRIYQEACLMNWSIGVAILTAAVLTETPLSALGVRSLDMSAFMAWPLIGKIAAVLLIVFYVLYHILGVLYPLLGGQLKREVGRRLEYVVDIVPNGRRERMWWAVTAVTAAVEELIFRGFCIFGVLLLWPSAPWIVAAMIACAFDGVRYLHRPRAGISVFLIGLVFALLYAMFGCIWAPMLTHFLQDIRVLGFPMEGIRKRVAERKAAAALAQAAETAAAP